MVKFSFKEMKEKNRNMVIYPVSLDAFHNLLRYGQINYSEGMAVEIELGSEQRGIEGHDLEKLISKIPPFDHDEELLFLEIELQDTGNYKDGGVVQKLDIRQVYKVFPSTGKGKKGLRGKIHSNVKLLEPIFEQAVNQSRERLLKKESVMGAKAAIDIMGLGKIDEKAVQTVMEAMEVRKEGKMPGPGESILHFAVCYERYEYFPTDDLGYYFDLNSIMAEYYNRSRKHKVRATESRLLRYLNGLVDKSLGLMKIFEMIWDDPELAVLRGTVKEDNIPVLEIIIFLWLREQVRCGHKLNNSNVEILIKTLKDSFPDAVRTSFSMVGAFFGWKEFNMELYAANALPFIYEGSDSEHTNELRSSKPAVKKHRTEERITTQQRPPKKISGNGEKTRSRDKSEPTKNKERVKSSSGIKTGVPSERILGRIKNDTLKELQGKEFREGQLELLSKCFLSALKRTDKELEKDSLFKDEKIIDLLTISLAREIEIHSKRARKAEKKIEEEEISIILEVFYNTFQQHQVKL